MTGPEPLLVTVAPDMATLVRPVAALVEHLRVLEHAPTLDGPLQQAAGALRAAPDPEDVVVAVRAMYKGLGLDPTKTRPSSEALLRRVRKGEPLPRVNSLVDVINWCSAESRLPFGLYDFAQIHGAIDLRRGRDGEAYPGIRKASVHLSGRLVLADARGPFGNPTSDSARTMVTMDTTRALVVIFAPVAAFGPAERALVTTRERLREYCGASEA